LFKPEAENGGRYDNDSTSAKPSILVVGRNHWRYRRLEITAFPGEPNAFASGERFRPADSAGGSRKTRQILASRISPFRDTSSLPTLVAKLKAAWPMLPRKTFVALRQKVSIS